MEETSSPPPRQPQSYRSQASNNWRVKDDSPRPQAPQPRARYNRGEGTQQSHSPSAGTHAQSGDESAGRRLYVGNLLYTAQRGDIEELFTSHGFNVVNVSISTDPFTGRNPSYCFVDVDTAEEAQRAIAELNGADVLGRGVKVSPGVAKRHGSAGGNGDSPAAAGGREVRVRNFERGWGRETKEERNTEYKPTFDRWGRNDASSHWTQPQSEGRRIYVGSLPRLEPQSAIDEEIQSLFSQYLDGTGITPSAVSKLISPHPSKASEPGNHYYCFIDLENAEDVDVVIKALDGREGSWGGNLRVNRAKGSDRKVVREQGLGSERRGGGSGWRKDAAEE